MNRAASSLRASEIGLVVINSPGRGDAPEAEKLMFAMPWFVADLAASLSHKVRYDNALSCGKVDDGEGCGIFDRVVERPSTLVKRYPVFRKALSKTNEIRDTVRRSN